MDANSRKDRFVQGFAPRRSGFTLIELAVVIGLVMVLVGLWLPALAKVRDRTKLTAWSSVMRQNFLATQTYVNDFGCFPLSSSTSSIACSQDWYRPMLQGQYLPREGDIDPNLRRYPDRFISVWLSLCVVTHASNLTLSPNPNPNPPSFRVRDDMVAFPSQKGILVRPFENANIINPEGFCCGIGPILTSPVAMADGSVVVGTYRDFNPGGELLIIQGLGVPVISTWGGYLARDR